MLNLETILSSKTFVRDGAGVAFQSAKDYIQPFIDVVSNLNPTFEVAISGRNANKNEDGFINESFARVHICAKLPDQFNVDEHTSVIGLVYGLDTQKPIMKVYSGRNAWACTNLAIFRADYIHQVELVQGTGSIYEKAKLFGTLVPEHVQQFAAKVSEMKKKIYEGREIDTVVGKLLRESINNKFVGTTPILSAVQALEDSKSVYAIRENYTTQWNLYSAVTQYVTDKVDIIDKPTKTVLISNIFDRLN